MGATGAGKSSVGARVAQQLGVPFIDADDYHDPSAMASRGISVDDLAGAIKNGTSYAGVGQFDGPTGTTLLTPHAQLEGAESYDSLIVGTRGASPVYLRDVAKATESVQDERFSLRFWVKGYGVPAATTVVAVNRQAGANAVEVSKSVRDLLPLISAELPGSVRANRHLIGIGTPRGLVQRDALPSWPARSASLRPMSRARLNQTIDWLESCSIAAQTPSIW